MVPVVNFIWVFNGRLSTDVSSDKENSQKPFRNGLNLTQGLMRPKVFVLYVCFCFLFLFLFAENKAKQLIVCTLMSFICGLSRLKLRPLDMYICMIKLNTNYLATAPSMLMEGRK